MKQPKVARDLVSYRMKWITNGKESYSEVVQASNYIDAMNKLHTSHLSNLQEFKNGCWIWVE